MSNSEDDSENFESADEFFSEDEESSVKFQQQSNVGGEEGKCGDLDRSAEMITVAADETTVEATATEEPPSPAKATCYRKRPERLKKSAEQSNGASAQSSVLLPAASEILKADELFHDITSHISLNINKGLINTFHQTSSSIKDLVLGSLPINSSASAKEESFLYDSDREDKSISLPSQDKKENVAGIVKNKTKFHSNLIALENDITGCNISQSSSQCHGNDVSVSEQCKEEDNSSSNNNRYEENERECQNRSEGAQVLQKGSKLNDIKNIVIDKEIPFKEITPDVRDENNLLEQGLDSVLDGKTPHEAEKGKNDLMENISLEKKVKNINEKEIVQEDSAADEKTFVEHEIDVFEEKVLPVKEVEEIANGKSLAKVDMDKLENEEMPFTNQREVSFQSNAIDLNDNLTKKESFTTDYDNRLSDKEGWSDFDVDVDEELDESQETVQRVEDKTASSTVGGQKVVFEETEGWDDFNISDEEIESTENKLETVKKNGERDQANSNITSDSKERDNKWTGWDGFGQKQASWNIGSWGVSTLLNTATAVTSNISAVSQGISSVLEAGLGAPDAETMARIHQMEKSQQLEKKESTGEKTSEKFDESFAKQMEFERRQERSSSSDRNESSFSPFGITNLVAGVTSKIVEHSKVHEIGSKVISGGLGTLENIGRKTMEALQEGDPGLKKKRALLLGHGKPVLSQVLRDAKEKAEFQDKKLENKEMARKLHFEILFDEFQGLIHLEALEMLSTQCELKLNQTESNLSGKELQEFLAIMEEVKELCEIDEDDLATNPASGGSFKKALTTAVEPLNEEISIQKIIEVHDAVEEWFLLEEAANSNSQKVHQKAVTTLAELTAATVHQFHKVGEKLLVKERRKTVEEVDALLQLTGVLYSEVENLSKRFLNLLKDIDSPRLGSGDGSSKLSANISSETKNATSYMKQAFDLLVPVMQLGAAT